MLRQLAISAVMLGLWGGFGGTAAQARDYWKDLYKHERKAVNKHFDYRQDLLRDQYKASGRKTPGRVRGATPRRTSGAGSTSNIVIAAKPCSRTSSTSASNSTPGKSKRATRCATAIGTTAIPVICRRGCNDRGA